MPGEGVADLGTLGLDLIEEPEEPVELMATERVECHGAEPGEIDGLEQAAAGLGWSE